VPTTFELAPLRRRDVVAALDVHGIAVEDFMRALFAAQAVPFAIKPLTLKMLLTIYQQQGDLPSSNVNALGRAERLPASAFAVPDGKPGP
jgi:hypothetical protein